MRRVAVLVASLFTLPLVLTACSGDEAVDAEPFETLQACYEEHHIEENLTVQQAIVVCCLDHPIAGVHPSCKDTQADCVAHVTAEIAVTVTASDIEAACTTYLSEKQ